MNTIAIIPARIGSKRIKEKNIKIFSGKPIICHVIETLRKSKLFKKIIVSTDSEKIGSIALDSGAEVPFYRNSKLSDDFAGTLEVIQDAIMQLKSKEYVFQNILSIYPTAVFTDIKLLKMAFRIFSEDNSKLVFPVKNIGIPYERQFFIKKNKLQFINKNNFYKRSQDLKITYSDSGQFYLASSNYFINAKRLITENSTPILTNKSFIDIDNINDWNISEIVYKTQK
jgi:pseudaminic acid cytidylyltransferase